MVKRFQYQTLLLSHCLQDIRFSETCNGSQTKLSSVSWIQYGQEIPMPELNAFNCRQDMIFLGTRNGSQTKLPSVSWIQYGQEIIM